MTAIAVPTKAAEVPTPELSVLVVEDEAIIALHISAKLVEFGYRVAKISASAEDALETLETSPVDLVLMDIHLGGEMDGIEAARRIRFDFGIPVVFLTSYADRETLGLAQEAEPFGYLAKPFQPASLSASIETALFKHKAEARVLQREAWLSTVLTATADAALVTDAAGRVQFMNPGAERLLECGLSEVAGLHWSEAVPLFHHFSSDPVEDLVAAVALKQESVPLPPGIELLRRGGARIPVEGEVFPSRVAGGYSSRRSSRRMAGTVITFRDVSKRVEMEAEVRHEQKMLAVGRLAGGVAHDFNNLLTVIIGYGTALLEDMRSPADRSRMEALLGAANSSADIAQQLLALSRRQVLATQLVSVNDSVKHFVRMVAPSLGAEIALSLDLQDSAGFVAMNPGQFQQLLLNLLLNARDAMPKGGPILLSTSHVAIRNKEGDADSSHSFVRIVVADSGGGIHPDIRENIFDPFFTTKSGGKGTGLGLALVYGIVKDAGGEISVASELGLGASFEILLPRVDRETDSPPPAKLPAPPESDSKTILFVEDEPGIRALVHNFFESKGYRMIVAEHGQEALALAEMFDGTIDLVISDVVMPKMDGPTLAERLAASRPGIKTLFISGHPGEAVQALRASEGSAGFLQKPFNLRTLLSKVTSLFAVMEAS